MTTIEIRYQLAQSVLKMKSCVGGYNVYKARTPLVLAYLNERYWPRFYWSCFCLVHFSVHFLHHHMRDSLTKWTLRIKGTVNRAQVAKKSYINVAWLNVSTCRLSCNVSSWVENFVTPGLTMKITKISTLRIRTT